MDNCFQTTLFAFFMMAALAAPADASPLDDATGAYENAQNAMVQARRSYQKAFNQLKPLAEQGDPKAQRILGHILLKGWVDAPDQVGGIAWLTKAAGQEDATARLELADLGGAVFNSPERQKLVQAAAEQGDAESQFSLGMDYDAGINIAKDAKEAFKWYLLAADQGHSLAQNTIGGMYMEGRGVAADKVRAYMWLSLTDAPPFPGEDLTTLAATMTSEQVAQAKKLANDWQPVMCRKLPGPCAYPKLRH
jgi:TPR repeat protein